MWFKDPHHPTEAELRAWSADPEAEWPMPDWDLVLAWGMEPGRLGLLAALASDATLPQRSRFLLVLYTWVSYVARQQDFELSRTQYDGWLDKVKGCRDAAVKRWRHQARRIFQKIEPFDQESWWARHRAEDLG
jgi:hypothetical protein